MASNKDQKSNKNSENQLSQKGEQNPGVRLAEINSNPNISLEEARNANEGKAPNASGSAGASEAEEHVPGTSDPESSDLPTSR
jgi:hypothetical protein